MTDWRARLCDEPPPAATGSYVNYRLSEILPSERAQDTSYQDGVLRQSRALLREASASSRCGTSPSRLTSTVVEVRGLSTSRRVGPLRLSGPGRRAREEHMSEHRTILVTGATGKVGRNVVAGLLDAGVGVRALVRTPTAQPRRSRRWPATSATWSTCPPVRSTAARNCRPRASGRPSRA